MRRLTVAQLFEEANLAPHGPVRWKTRVPETNPGVYVIARTSDVDDPGETCALLLNDATGLGLQIDPGYEKQRWLPSEPVIYIGKADESIQRRVAQFYQHRCGNSSPHAGGQIMLLLQHLSDLWVYWSPSDAAVDSESTMLRAFAEQTNQMPFANFDGRRGAKRVRRLSV